MATQHIGTLDDLEIHSTLRLERATSHTLFLEGGIEVTRDGVRWGDNPPKDAIVECYQGDRKIGVSRPSDIVPARVC